MEQLMIPELETPAPAKARPAWPLVKLGEVCEINPRHPKNLDSNLLVSFVPMQSISETSKSVTSEDIRPYAEVSKSYTPFEKGDVLLAKITPCFENGKVAIANISRQYGTGSSEFHVFRPKSQELLATEFLYYAFQLQSFINDAAKNMTGSAGQKRVPKLYLESYQILLPPLAEQQRIVARLDLAQRLIDQRKAQLALMDQLVQSLFYEMFGDPVKNEMGWEVKDLLEITNFENGDRSSSYPSGKDILDSGILFFGTQNIGSDGYFNPSDLKFISLEKFNSLSRGKLKQGDLVISLRGSVGNSCLFYSDKYLSGFINAQLMIIRPDSFIDNLYLLCYLRLDKTLSKLKEIASGSAVPQLTASQLKTFKVLFPPLSLQQTFADRVQQIEALKQQMQASLAELEQGFQALMQEAFGH